MSINKQTNSQPNYTSSDQPSPSHPKQRNRKGIILWCETLPGVGRGQLREGLEGWGGRYLWIRRHHPCCCQRSQGKSQKNKQTKPQTCTKNTNTTFVCTKAFYLSPSWELRQLMIMFVKSILWTLGVGSAYTHKLGNNKGYVAILNFIHIKVVIRIPVCFEGATQLSLWHKEDF